jgi:hypothetical protein
MKDPSDMPNLAATEALADLPPTIRSIQVGRLQEMAVREVWPMEERHLTPWLAENLDVLETELGLRLELVEREHRVGRYELDLLLRSVDDGRTVIVENQFGPSDHNHLGQLLAYSAGTEADVIVWLAESFTDEHLAALEWMNTAMGESAGFFALTLKAVKIGDSLPAPIMETKLRPNEWLKSTARQRQVVQRAAAEEYDWERYRDELRVPADRLDVGQRLVVAVEQALANRGLELRTVFRKGYVGFQRPGDYNVLLVDVYWNNVPRLAVKIPAEPSVLGLASPYPHLRETWNRSHKEWGFTVSPGEPIPDLDQLLELVLPFQPETGPARVPAS